MEQLEGASCRSTSRTSGSIFETGRFVKAATTQIERPLPPQGAGRNLAGERAIAFVVQPRPRTRASAAGRSDRPLFTARSTSYAASRAAAIMTAGAYAGATLCPLRNSRTVIGRRPSGCI